MARSAPDDEPSRRKPLVTFVKTLSLGITVLAMFAILGTAAEHLSETYCNILSPEADLPPELSLIRDLMPYSEVVELLGEPDYSPIDGQHYYWTGGRCSLYSSGGRYAACGFVLEYRDYDRMVEMAPIRPGDEPRFRAFLPDKILEWRLHACSWGGIGE